MTTTPESLNFGPGTTIETLTGRAYTINEAATEYSGAREPATVTLNLTSPNVAANFFVAGGIGDASGEGEYTFPATLNVNFADRMVMNGLDARSAGNITITGHQLVNDGYGVVTFFDTQDTTTLMYSHAVINADVVGVGGWGMWLSDLTIDGKVGSGQSFDLSTGSNLTIDDPHHFSGSINEEPWENASVTLNDLTATSYSYVNNMLTLYDGNRPVDNLRFTENYPSPNHPGGPTPFYVSSSGGNVIIGENQPASGLLAMHTAGV